MSLDQLYLETPIEKEKKKRLSLLIRMGLILVVSNFLNFLYFQPTKAVLKKSSIDHEYVSIPWRDETLFKESDQNLKIEVDVFNISMKKIAEALLYKNGEGLFLKFSALKYPELLLKQKNQLTIRLKNASIPSTLPSSHFIEQSPI